jgi:hypothetical protein
MPEKFDFRKKEDQEKFGQLPEEEKNSLVEEAHEEALILNEMRDRILELLKLKDDENLENEIEAKSKIKDILSTEVKNIAIHTTRISSLYSILKFGLLSHERLGALKMRNSLFDPVAQRNLGNMDLISFTFSSGIDRFWGDGRTTRTQLLHWEDPESNEGRSNLIHLIFDSSKEAFLSKFKNFSKPGFSDLRSVPVRGELHAEYLSDGLVEVEHLDGLAIDKRLLGLSITQLLYKIIENEKATQSREYDLDLIGKSYDWKDRPNWLNYYEKNNLETTVKELNNLGIKIIGVGRTDNNSIYRMVLEIDGEQYRILNEFGTLDIPTSLKKKILDKIQDNPNDADTYLEFLGLSKDFKEDKGKRPKVKELMTQLRRLLWHPQNNHIKNIYLTDNENDLRKKLSESRMVYLSLENPKNEFKYKKSKLTEHFERLVFMLKEVVGDVSVENVLELLGKSLKIPIYAIDSKNEESQIVYPTPLPR